MTAKGETATPLASVTMRDGRYVAVCPYCRGETPLGAWAVAHLATDKMHGACAVCGKPHYTDERELAP